MKSLIIEIVKLIVEIVLKLLSRKKKKGKDEENGGPSDLHSPDGSNNGGNAPRAPEDQPVTTHSTPGSDRDVFVSAENDKCKTSPVSYRAFVDVDKP